MDRHPSEPEPSPPARATRAFVVAVALVAALWDLVVYLVWGGPATISTQVGDWLASAWGWLLLPVAGVTVGHLLGMMPPGTPAALGRLALFGAAVAGGYWVTRSA